MTTELSRDARACLRAKGYALMPAGALSAADAREPWSAVARLLGERPLMAERQPIRPVPGGRSFASTARFTPLHTDSQEHLGRSPNLQIMLCSRPAARGGEMLLCDGYALLDRLRDGRPSLYDALFSTIRRIPFVFGDVVGPTVTLWGSHLALTHAPMKPPLGDAVGAELEMELSRAPLITLTPRAGEIVLVDNHRMLHGRRAFDDPDREFVRILAWLRDPLGASPVHAAAAQARGAARVERRASPKLSAVIEMLTGVPPGLIAAREGIPEPTLYAWRRRAIEAASRELDGDG